MSNLDLIIKDLNKKMKVGNIQLGVDFQEVQEIPFSSCRLNYMTYGGIPVGRIAEFYGADGSGKTTTAIDVAIQIENKIAEENQKIVDTEIVFDDVSLSQLYCDDTEVIEEHLENYKKCAEYHKQLVDWLEELKALKNGLKIKCDNLNEALEKGKKIGYNKALDDFVKFASDMPTVEEEDGTIRPMWLEEMAEQLKAGGKNE